MAPENGANEFQFPQSHHLVVVTKRRVLAWDASEVRPIFNSGSAGILAAKESGNGSGTLAIADSQTVILHKVEKTRERSYRLKGADGQIRLLHFSPDCGTLFFSTTLLAAVQAYSIAGARLLDPPPGATHPSPPVALAVSPRAHLLVSASERPPSILVQSLAYGGAPQPVAPRASASAASCVAFHPTRASLFLVAFRDGSLALFDGTKLARGGGGGGGSSRGGPGHGGNADSAEVASFTRLHQSAAVGDGDTGAITGAAFLPNSKARVVTVGLDGKCNVVDFDKGSVVKSWHVRGPATALSVCAPEERKSSAAGRRTKSTTKASLMRPIIAVGRIDGKVLLYDTSGRLLQEKMVDEDFDRVIDLGWIVGKSPDAVSKLQGGLKEHAILELDIGQKTKPIKTTRTSRAPKATALPPKPNEQKQWSDADSEPSDAVAPSATVKHIEQKSPILISMPNPAGGNAYMDLFSPLRPPPDAAAPIRATSPRSRPRITSTTFVGRAAEPFALAGSIPSLPAPAGPGIDSDSLREAPPLPEPDLPPPTPPPPPKAPEPPTTATTTEAEHPAAARRQAPSPPRRIVLRARGGTGSLLNIPPGLLVAQNERLAAALAPTPTVPAAPAAASADEDAPPSNARILRSLRTLRDGADGGGGVVAGATGGVRSAARRPTGVLAPYYHHGVARAGNKAASAAAATKRLSPAKKLPPQQHRRRSRQGERRSREDADEQLVRAGTRRRSVRVRVRPRVPKSREADLWLTDSGEEEEMGEDSRKGTTSQSPPPSSSAATATVAPAPVASPPLSLESPPSTLGSRSTAPVDAESPSGSVSDDCGMTAPAPTASACPPSPPPVPRVPPPPPSHLSPNSPTSSSSLRSSPRPKPQPTDKEAQKQQQQQPPNRPPPLPPGFAQSYAGPVAVERYLPRRGSRAVRGASAAQTQNQAPPPPSFPPPPPPPPAPPRPDREPSSPLSPRSPAQASPLLLSPAPSPTRPAAVRRKPLADTAAARARANAKAGGECCGCRELRSEVARLRAEVESLRRAVHGNAAC